MFFLWFLFELPAAFQPTKMVFSKLRPSAEMLALLTLGAASYQVRWGKAIRVVLVVSAILLALVRIDAMIFRMIVREDALLYDQLFMLRHTAVLVSDLWSTTMILSLLGGLLVIAFLIWLVRRLWSSMLPLVQGERIGETATVGFVMWLVALPLSGAHVVGLTRKPVVRWETLALADNVVRSRATYRAVQRAFKEPPYADLKQVKLAQKPDVLLVLVESYGRIMATDAGMRPGYLAMLDDIDKRTRAAGFNAVSAYSRAPISGGRSWLAAGSVMMGTSVKYESVFHHLISNVKKLNTMASFFKGQGYDTIQVLPADRARPGIGDIVNRYGFDEVVHFATLDYTGPSFGWGIVPDQFAFDFVDEHYVRAAQKPLFVDFHMVSSHAPWAALPELVDDYHTLEALEGSREIIEERTPQGEVLKGAKRFTRKDGGRLGYMGEMTRELAERYAQTVQYSMEVVTRFLERREKDALVIVMGDHQPPLISADDESFDVPVHVFAKTNALLDEFRQHGFADGMRAEETGKTELAHGGLLTLMARALARTYDPSGALPALHMQGVDLVK